MHVNQNKTGSKPNWYLTSLRPTVVDLLDPEVDIGDSSLGEGLIPSIWKWSAGKMAF